MQRNLGVSIDEIESIGDTEKAKSIINKELEEDEQEQSCGIDTL